MGINCYALEMMTRARLADLRANAAHYTLLESLRTSRPSVWAALGSALLRFGRRSSRRETASPRPA